MAEQEGKVSRLVSIDVAEKFEVLQDEVDLIKIEVKQTLVDLREFMMKEQTLFPRATSSANGTTAESTPANHELPGEDAMSTSAVPTAPSEGRGRKAGGRLPAVEPQSADYLDAAMLGNIIGTKNGFIFMFPLSFISSHAS